MTVSTSIGFTSASKNARLGLLNTDLSGGTLKIYNGTRPTTADTALGIQTLLVTMTLPSPAGTVSGGVLTIGTVDSSMAIADGTASWSRAFTSGSVAVADFDVGYTGSGAAITLDSVSLTTGGLLSKVSMTVSEG